MNKPPMSPKELEEIQFDVVWGGYSMGLVDDFIDQVIVNINAGRWLLEGTSVTFKRELRGYERGQVDAMIARLNGKPSPLLEPNTVNTARSAVKERPRKGRFF